MADSYLKKSIPADSKGMDFSWAEVTGTLKFSIGKLRGCQDNADHPRLDRTSSIHDLIKFRLK
jgi:hypothetical protein